MLRSWKASVGSSSLGQLCPKLTHLTLAHCVFGHGCDRSIGCPAGLQHLTLCGSIMFGVPAGVIPFLSPKLKSVDISSTQIADNELREIVSPPVAALHVVVICIQYGPPTHKITSDASIRVEQCFPD